MSIFRINAIIIHPYTQAQNDSTVVVLEDPSFNTNWWGILLLIVLALFATWLKRKLR